jgi:hypothetical protein
MNRARHELSKLTLIVGLVVVSFAFVAQAQTINELSYTGAWTNQSLRGTQATQFFSIAAFVTTPNNQAHVYYSGVDGHIHQRYQGGGQGAWIDEDLTVETHGPTINSLSRVSGFSQQNFQYVFYTDINGHIHQLLYNNYVWSDQDITASGGGILSENGLFAMTTTPNNQIHVYYEGATDADLHQLFFNGTRWSDTDLTTAGGGGKVSGMGPIITGVTIGNYQYVFYETDIDSSAPSVHEMYYNNIRWTDVNLTISAGVPAGDPLSLTALVVPGTQTIKVYYSLAWIGDFIELTSSNNSTWSALDITRAGNGSTTFSGNQIVAFATTPNNQIHVYYAVGGDGTFGGDTDVHQLYYNGSRWSDEDLSTETHSAGAYYSSPMAGFAIGNSQYIFYGQ